MRKIISLLLLFVIALSLGSCKEQPVDDPVVPPTPENPKTFKCSLESAERLDNEALGEAFGDRDFVLRFENEGEGVRLVLHLVGDADSNLLTEGKYVAGENFVLANTSLTLADKGVEIVDGGVTIAIVDECYSFDIALTDGEGDSYVMSYDGEVQNLYAETPIPPVVKEPVDFTPTKVVASLYAKGHFMVKLFVDDTLYHKLDMYDRSSEAGVKYLNAGEYSFENGGVGKEWSSFGYYAEDSESVVSCGFEDVALKLSVAEDYRVAIEGEMRSELGDILLVEWSGSVEGFDFKPEPDVVEDVEFEANMLVGTYYGSQYSGTVGNYYIYLTDNGFTAEGGEKPNTTYYRLDLYGPLYDGERDGYVSLPEGRYKLDHDSTMASGTFDVRYSGYWQTDDMGVCKGSVKSFESGELVVAVDQVSLTVVVDGVTHRVHFAGEQFIKDNAPTEGEGVSMEAKYAYAVYYGDQFTMGRADNFYLYLSDLGLDANKQEQANATYYRFDIYTDIAQSNGGRCVPDGEYIFDASTSYAVGSFGSEYSIYYVRGENGTPLTQAQPSEGVLRIEGDSIYAEVMIDGVKHTVTFSGKIEILNVEDGDDDGGDDDGGDDGGDDKPTPEDRVCRFEGAKLYYEYCGDIYNSGFNSWTLLIANDDMSDEWLMLEVMTDAMGSESFYGEYRVSDEYGEYVALQGSMIVDGSSTYTYGSWYVDAENGELIQLSDGWIKIESAGEKLVRVEFEVADSRGVTLICDWTGSEVSVLDLVDTSSVKSLRRSAQRVLSPSVVY